MDEFYGRKKKCLKLRLRSNIEFIGQGEQYNTNN